MAPSPLELSQLLTWILRISFLIENRSFTDQLLILREAVYRDCNLSPLLLYCTTSSIRVCYRPNWFWQGQRLDHLDIDSFALGPLMLRVMLRHGRSILAFVPSNSLSLMTGDGDKEVLFDRTAACASLEDIFMINMAANRC